MIEGSVNEMRSLGNPAIREIEYELEYNLNVDPSHLLDFVELLLGHTRTL